MRYESYQQLRLLLYLLHQNGIAVSFAPPQKKQIKHFSRMMMPVTKTDEKDAYMIAMYGEKMNPPIYKMPSQATIRILTTEGFTYFDTAKLLQKSEMRKNMVMDLIYRGFINAANYSESHYNPRRSQIKTELRYLFVTTPNR